MMNTSELELKFSAVSACSLDIHVNAYDHSKVNMLHFVKAAPVQVLPRRHVEHNNHQSVGHAASDHPYAYIGHTLCIVLYMLLNVLLLFNVHHETTTMSVSNTNYRTSHSHSHCNDHYDIEYYTNNITIDLAQNVLHFNVSMLYNSQRPRQFTNF